MKTRIQWDSDYVHFFAYDPDDDPDCVYHVRAERHGGTWHGTAGSIWVTDIDPLKIRSAMATVGYDPEIYGKPGPIDIADILISHDGAYQWGGDEQTVQTDSEWAAGVWISARVERFDAELSAEIREDMDDRRFREDDLCGGCAVAIANGDLTWIDCEFNGAEADEFAAHLDKAIANLGLDHLGNPQGDPSLGDCECCGRRRLLVSTYRGPEITDEM